MKDFKHSHQQKKWEYYANKHQRAVNALEDHNLHPILREYYVNAKCDAEKRYPSLANTVDKKG